MRGTLAPEQRFVYSGGLGDAERHAVLGRHEAGGCGTRRECGNDIRSAAGIRRVAGRGAGQRAAQRVEHELVDRLRVAEPHFALGRVHVDIDAPRIHLERQHVRRVAVVVQHVLIGLAQRVGKHFVAHETAVDEPVLRVARAAGGRRGADQAVKPDAARFRVDPDRRGAKVVAEHGVDALGGALRFQVPLGAPIVLQPERDIRPRQRDALERFVAMRVFGGFDFRNLRRAGVLK